MRVGIVVPGGIDPSGRERVIPALLWLVERLAVRHDTHVFVLYQSDAPHTYELLGAKVHDLGLSGGRNTVPGLGLLRARRALESALREAGAFDVLHAFWATAPGFLATAVGRRLGLPVAVSLGGDELVDLPEIGYGAQRTHRGRFLVKRSLRSAACVTAASGPMCRAAEGMGLDVDRIPLGADAALFSGEPAAEGPPWRLLHVADLNPVKDQETLLATFARVVRGIPDVVLDIVGRDTLDGRIQERAQELGIGDRIRFHGSVPVDDLVRFYRQAHLLVVSSRHEAGPLVFMEASLAGVPTVGTAVGHLADLAPEGAAVAVPVGDAGALADAIASLLSRPDERRALAAKARAFALRNDAAETARRFGALYERINAART